nr:hypothetical protein CFP56_66182 [Quercus suber]
MIEVANSSFIKFEVADNSFVKIKVADSSFIKIVVVDSSFVKIVVADNNSFVKIEVADSSFIKIEVTDISFVKIEDADGSFVKIEVVNSSFVKIEVADRPFVRLRSQTVPLSRSRSIFLPFEAKTILNIPLSYNMPKEKIIWVGNRKGEFTVKSAYYIVLKLIGAEDEGESSIKDYVPWSEKKISFVACTFASYLQTCFQDDFETHTYNPQIFAHQFGFDQGVQGYLSTPALPTIVASLAFKSSNLIKVLVSGSKVPFASPSEIGLPSPRFKAWWFGIRECVRNFGENGSQRVDIPPIFQGDLTLKPSIKAKPFAIKRKGKNVKVSAIKKPRFKEVVLQTQSKVKATLLAQDASIQEVVSKEETKSEAKKGDSNRVYTDNPQEKEDFTEVTSKDQERESTKVDSNPLISLLSPPLKAVCSKLLSKYPEIVGDTNK